VSSISPQDELKSFSNRPSAVGLDHSFVFGMFRLDLGARRLLHDGREVSLTPKAFEALSLLVQGAGRMVSKHELMAHLWPDTFVNESNLTQTIFMLRKALGDSGIDRRYIVTVPGRGYRFEAKVSVQEPCAGPPIVELPAEPHKTVVNLLAYAIALAAVVALLSTVYRTRRPGSPAMSPRRISLAVLPFENLTGDPAQEYFSDGLTEDMITRLGIVDPQHISVIGRTSVMRYKTQQEPFERIGRELGVQYALEGGVQRSGGTVRITANLIRVDDQTRIWGCKLDRQLTNLLTLQDEITREIGDKVALVIDATRPNPPPRLSPLSPRVYQAYDLSLKGRYFWNKRNAEGFHQAATFFRKAIEADPSYAPAYAGLADTYTMMSAYGFVLASELMPKAREAAMKAVLLDYSSAEAHTSLAVVFENYDWNGPAAEKEFLRAIELNPNYATARQWYAEFLALQGRFNEALSESEQARQLDPLSLVIAADNGAIFYFSRQYSQAIERFQSVLNMDPAVLRAHLIIAAYAQNGQFRDALTDIASLRRNADVPTSWAWQAYVYGRMGDTIRARHALNELELAGRRLQVDPAQFLNVAYAGIADKQLWLSWLEKVCRQRTSIPTAFRVDPIYDPIRNDSRFKSLLAEVHFSP
jgi:TolB-like protein/DNA-binding winged helix-turn-helix (wHTH) protein/Tfp pilus assembly protein PilF